MGYKGEKGGSLMSNEKKKVGIYIGSGLPPDDIEAGISVDVNGRDIGIMISGSADNPEEVPPIPEIMDSLAEQYPEHKPLIDSYKTQYKASGSKEEEDSILYSFGTWIKNHIDNVEVGVPGVFKITFKP
jgi:hypothetical protein